MPRETVRMRGRVGEERERNRMRQNNRGKCVWKAGQIDQTCSMTYCVCSLTLPNFESLHSLHGQGQRKEHSCCPCPGQGLSAWTVSHQPSLHSSHSNILTKSKLSCLQLSSRLKVTLILQTHIPINYYTQEILCNSKYMSVLDLHHHFT